MPSPRSGETLPVFEPVALFTSCLCSVRFEPSGKHPSTDGPRPLSSLWDESRFGDRGSFYVFNPFMCALSGGPCGSSVLCLFAVMPRHERGHCGRPERPRERIQFRVISRITRRGLASSEFE